MRGDNKQPLITDARARLCSLLTETAARYDIEASFEEAGPVELSCRWLRQPTFDLDIAFWLSGDEFGCGGDDWYATIFSTDDPGRWPLIERVTRALPIGEARIVRWHIPGRVKPFWTELQLREAGRWRSVSTGVGCAVPPLARRSIERHGHPIVRGGLRPAYGSLLLLVLFAMGAWKLFT